MCVTNARVTRKHARKAHRHTRPRHARATADLSSERDLDAKAAVGSKHNENSGVTDFHVVACLTPIHAPRADACALSLTCAPRKCTGMATLRWQGGDQAAGWITGRCLVESASHGRLRVHKHTTQMIGDMYAASGRAAKVSSREWA